MIRTKNALLLPSGFAIAVFQAIVVALFRYYLYFTGGFKAHIHLKARLKHSQRYIIVANHQSMLDPFAIFALLPLRQRLRLLPLKFMTIPKVYHRWYIKPFAFILGCFPAHTKERNHHTYGIDGTIKLLRYGYNICLFPEGTRTLQKDSQPKHGIVKILEEYPDAQLVLAHLDWTFPKKGKKHITMTAALAPDTLDKSNPRAIMDAIYAL